MSLDWDVSKVNKSVCFIGEGEERQLSGVTAGIIYATIPVGIGEITDKNKFEFACRLEIIQDISGPYLVDGKGKPVRITVEDVYRHVGLRTNASSWTFAQMMKGLRKSVEGRVSAITKGLP